MKGQLAQWTVAVLVLAQVYKASAVVYSGVDDSEFETLTKGHDLAVVSFCVPWFEPCNELTAELHATAANLAHWSVPVVEIDCNKTAAFCASFDVISYPTIRIFKQANYTRYRGKFKSPAITTHVLREILPAVSYMDHRSFDVLKSLDLPLLLAVLPEDDEASAQAFTSAAELLRPNFIMGVTHDVGLSGQENAEAPFLAVFNVLDETVPVYHGAFETSRLLAFAKQHSTPLIGKLELSSLAYYMKAGIPLAVMFAEEEAERRSLANSLQAVAMKFRGMVNFATADAGKLPFLAEPMGLQPGRFPAFALQTSADSFPFDQSKEITSDAIDRFITEVLGKSSRPDREL